MLTVYCYCSGFNYRSSQVMKLSYDIIITDSETARISIAFVLLWHHFSERQQATDQSNM